ncbi:MAG TPA: hypothetical protein VM345_08820 [Acidimicrobiales bacterium]|nr:hypothetical protein [Acidimicrobiales bacterium]
MDLKPLLTSPSIDTIEPVARAGEHVVAATTRIGEGTVLALSVDPVAHSLAGHELLPWLTAEIAGLAAVTSGPRRTALEVYFDPGLLPGASVEQVADLLAEARIVHVAGWNKGFNDPADDYPFDRLIEALHERGVLAYAWIAPPFVNLAFWDRYPECREKTADGRDARVFWRSLIALYDERCFNRAWSEVWTPLLDQHEWDGVNVAELYFEPNVVPDEETPYHPVALRRFGRSPASDREGFARFRSDLVVELNDAMLRQLNGHPRASEMELVITVIDDLLDPAVGAAVGSDVARLSDVARRNGATVQLEDPFSTWGHHPLRYDRLAERLDQLTTPGQRAIDVNVVDRRDARPTSRATGAELELALASAGRVGRVAVYAAGTIADRDLAVAPAAIAGAAQVFDTGVKAPWTTQIRAPGGPAFGRLVVDGTPWPAARGVALLPAGEHRVEWSVGNPVSPAVVRFTGELGEMRIVDGGRVEFTYESRSAAFASVVGDVRRIMVDGVALPSDAAAGAGGTRVVRLPKGAHRVTLEP